MNPTELDQLYTARNQQLLDMLFRHAVYLEGWKTGLVADYKEMLARLYTEFAIYMKQTRYVRMDQFTRGQLALFVYKFAHVQQRFYSSFTERLIILLREFLAVDVDIQKQIYEYVAGKDVITANRALSPTITADHYDGLSPTLQADYSLVNGKYKLSQQYRHNENASGIYGFAAVDGTADADQQLWANINHAPIPANGLTLVDMLDQFGTKSMQAISATINMGYANGWTVDATELALLGKNSNFEGGLLGALLLQGASVITTGSQHVSSEIGAAIASVYYENYQWVSVLDAATTQICIDRNGNVYVFGEGPLPPAHYRCRSRAVAIQSGTKLHNIPESIAAWFQSQPAAFLADVFGSERSAGVAAGNIPINTISTSLLLTLSEFQGKVTYILGAKTNAA